MYLRCRQLALCSDDLHILMLVESFAMEVRDPPAVERRELQMEVA
jgi:hypothetical protein